MMKCNFMFAKNSKAYSVYLLFRFVCSPGGFYVHSAFHRVPPEVVQLDAFQLVLFASCQKPTSPAIEERRGLLKDFVCLFKLNLGFIDAPVLLALLAITLWGDCQ